MTSRNIARPLAAALLSMAMGLAAWPGAGAADEAQGIRTTRGMEPDGVLVAQKRPTDAAMLFDNGNIYAVYNQPSRATTFRLDDRARITTITTYHWNDARGDRAGAIALLSNSGRIYGPWQATGSPGQGGVPNAYWTVHPNITLPAGRYTVLDSDLFTWSQNEGTDGAGFARIEGSYR
ncbi:MAG: hypothetical protein ACYC0C_01175 [Devosia sp.]